MSPTIRRVSGRSTCSSTSWSSSRMATRTSRCVAEMRISRFMCVRAASGRGRPHSRRPSAWQEGGVAQGGGRQADAPTLMHNSRLRFPEAHDRPCDGRQERVTSHGRCKLQRHEGTVRDSTASPAIGHDGHCLTPKGVGPPRQRSPVRGVLQRGRPAVGWVTCGRRRFNGRESDGAWQTADGRYGHCSAVYAPSSRSSCREITMRWISLVPSPISQTFASRIMRSTG